MTGKRQREILQAARNRVADVPAPPVAVERVLEKEAIRLIFEPFDDRASGVAYHDHSTRVIGVNAAHSYRRQRFTIAHELGHLVLHDDQPLHVDRQVVIVGRRNGVVQRDAREQEADLFAAELLMPDALIIRDLDLLRDTTLEAFMRRMAARYEVSEQAMSIRLAAYVDLIAEIQ